MATSTKKEKNLPSLLSFERKLELSDALMFSGSFDDTDKKNTEIERDDKGNVIKSKVHWQPIEIRTRKNRGTISSHGASEKDMLKPNPKFSDNDGANLCANNNTLKISFSMRIIGNLGKPFACNKPDFEKSITKKIDQDKNEVVKTLAFRYAYNIANGRFLWRNRVGAEQVIIKVECKSNNNENETLTFNGYDFSLSNFDKNKEHVDLQKLTQVIQQGLLATGDDQFSFITVQAFVKLIDGQQVFPSEEMNMGDTKKTLAKREGCAAIHDVKIGNAIKTIDTWYGDTVMMATGIKNSPTDKISIEGEEKKPIAIEPFGSVTQRGSAFRFEKVDLYSLMVNWVNENDETKQNEILSFEDKCYVTACLIRGGVFSRKSTK